MMVTIRLLKEGYDVIEETVRAIVELYPIFGK